MVKVKNICKNYGVNECIVKALDRCNLEIKDGMFMSVTGSSGSGKSTLLNIIGGILAPDSGNLEIDDVDITKLSENELLKYRRSNIGYIYQSFCLLPELTVEENIKLPTYFANHKIDEKRFQDLTEMLGLKSRLMHRANQLSGGQQQRVAIARALLNNPRLILCDEPTGNLDSESGKNVMKILLELQKKYKTTIIMVTHNLSLAKMTDAIIQIENGKIVGESPK